MMMRMRGMPRHRAIVQRVLGRMMRDRDGNHAVIEARRRAAGKCERHARAEHAEQVGEDEQPSR